MDRFDRVFQLNNILQAARLPVTRRRLEQELECSRATVKRIIEDLRDFLGAPIKYDRKRNGYYYDHSEQQLFELPGLWFNASELYALLSAQQLLANTQPGLLDRHLQPLRKRIDEILKIQHAGGSEVARRIRILQMAARPAGEWFKTVAGAVSQRRCLMVDYYNREQDRTTERRISPQRLVHYRDNWYLDAWCHLRKGLRTFALDAIRHAHPLDQEARDVPDDRLQAHFGSAYGIFAGQADRTAVLRFNARRARWVAKEQWHSDQQGRFLEDGSYELRVPYHDARELIMDILKYGPDVEVIAPEALRSEVHQLLQGAAAVYQQDAEGVEPNPA
jgi:predicted DNA-binding transcriptional regulator YafY